MQNMFPCCFSSLPAYLRTAFNKKRKKMCTCPQGQALFDTGFRASSAGWLLQAICIRTFAPLHAAGCLQASLPSRILFCEISHWMIYVNIFQPWGCYWLRLPSWYSPSSLCCFITLPESRVSEKLKQHISVQAPLKPRGKYKNTWSSQALSSIQLVHLDGWFPAQASEGETEDLYIIRSKSQLEGCCIVFPVNLLLLHKTMSSFFCSSRQVCSEEG